MARRASKESRVTPAAQGGDGLLLPITLELGPIRRLLVIDVGDDPTYRALEPQVLDGPDGDGLVLLAYRHDGQVELYAEPQVQVDPAGYDGLGEGVHGIHHTEFEAARFEVTEDGLKVDVAFTAPNGRRVDLRMHEHLTGPRDRFPVLAPVGGAFDTPAFFPFIWLPGLSFVPVRGSEVALRVDGEVRTIPRLPLPLGGRRCLMARYDPQVMACELNSSRFTDPPGYRCARLTETSARTASASSTWTGGQASRGCGSTGAATGVASSSTHRCRTSPLWRRVRATGVRSCCRRT